jgi:hypothetical protein
MQIACEIYFVNTREGRANKTVERRGIFQKFEHEEEASLVVAVCQRRHIMRQTKHTFMPVHFKMCIHIFVNSAVCA